jgi:hypothetical protein
MKKVMLFIMSLVIGGFVMAGYSFAAPLSGDLSVKYIGLPDKDNVYRLGEYSSLTDTWYASGLNLDFLSKAGFVKLSGVNLGAGDVNGSEIISYKRLFNFDGQYAKTPHLLDLSSGYSTERVAEKYSLSLLPLSRVSVKVTSGVEDKTGRLAPTNYVGQKTENSSVAAQVRIGAAVLSGGLAKEEFSENKAAHDADSTNINLALIPKNRFWASASSDKKDIDPAMANPGKTIELDRSDVSMAYTISKSLALSSTYSDQERTNLTAGAASYDDSYMATNVNYSAGRIGKVGVSYTTTNRDYAGASVTSADTDKIKVKYSTKLLFFGIKAGYSHGYRDVSGVNDNALINFQQLSSEFADKQLSVDLLGFKKFGLSYYEKTGYKKYTPYADYGTSANLTSTWGLTSYYIPDEKTLLTASFYDFKNRMEGRQLFWRTDANAGRILLDTNLQIYNGSNCFQFGTTYSYSADTTLTADYLVAVSELKDPQQGKKVTENILNLGLEKLLTKTYTMNVNYTHNAYTDNLDSDYERGNNKYEIELTKKF